MKAYSFRIIAMALLVAGLAGCAGTSAANPLAINVDTVAQTAKKNSFAAKKTMRAFRSEQELKSYFREIAEKQKRKFATLAGGVWRLLALSAPQHGVECR